MKTSRARIESLILINWNGFFYQRFEMDAGVTALEGENGAGKTTVMVGAFVALLPDQRLLQFRNVSEAGGMEGDRGIYGRLGARGPAYTFLEIRVPNGERMLAGVMLKKKTPPSLELTPFLVEGLTGEVALEQVLLIRNRETERIPELADLRQKLGQEGITLNVCDSVGQYTSTLFELGITPMRMEAYAERDKFNRMLQTSMYGGLSSSIQKGLRDYLLAEDYSLRNHVARMRENLDACRVTHREIVNAERKYQVIEGIFKSGYGMLESAFHGTRLKAAGLKDVSVARKADHLRCKSELDGLKNRVRELERRHTKLKSDLEEREKVQIRADDILRDCRQARKIAVEIERLSSECLMAGEELEQNKERLSDLKRRFQDCESNCDRLSTEKDQIAEGLSDASKAWEQVSRKVALFKLARQTLEDSRKALPDREVAEERVTGLLEECRREWNQALESKTRIARELESLDARIASYEETTKALRSALQRDVTPECALEEAQGLDSHFREMERVAGESQSLPGKIKQVARKTERQQAIRKKIAGLDAMGEKVESAADFRSLFESMHGEQNLLAEERSGLQERLALFGEERVQAERQIESLGSEAREWKQARHLAGRLEAEFSAEIVDGQSLEEFEQKTRYDLESVGSRLRRLLDERETAQGKLSELEFGGGRLDEALVRLRDLVDGTLAAELYDDTPEQQAPTVEARLGPLHGAILVEDVPEAAGIISHEPDRPDHVWLMEAGALKAIPDGKPYPGAELVKMGEAWRLSRHPERPVVGRAARELEIERLRTHADNLRAEIETVRSEEAHLLDGIEKVGMLKRYYRFIGAPDPGKSVESLQDRLKEIQRRMPPHKPAYAENCFSNKVLPGVVERTYTVPA